VLYDAGALGEDARALLGAEVQRGVVDVVDFWEMRKYSIHNYGEVGSSPLGSVAGFSFDCGKGVVLV